MVFFKGFEVLDKINLYVSGNATIENVVKKFEDVIRHDTLADNVIYDAKRENYIETSINGEILDIDVEKLETLT